MGIVISFFSDDVLENNDKQRESKSHVVLDYNKVYETRMYESQCWISTMLNSENESEIKQASKRSSKMLKRYLNGRNAKQIHLGYTNTIICKIFHPWSINDPVSVSMVIPKEFKKSPPQPSTNEIFVEEQHKRLIYATKLDKSTREVDWKEAYLQTIDLLDHNEENYVAGVYYRVNYNKGGMGACNELWVIGVAIDHEYICLSDD